MTNVVDDSETGTIPAAVPPKCGDYTTQSACEAVAGCYWYDGACHSSPPPEACGQYTTQSECEAAKCYWYDEACHSYPPSPDWMQYLPLILIGGGIALVVAAVVIPKPKIKQ